MNKKNNTTCTNAENRAVLARLVRSTSEMVRNAFAPSGCVRTRFLAEIDTLPDTEVAIRAYAVTLGPRVAEAIHGEIETTFARARDAASALTAKGRRPRPSAPPAIVQFCTDALAVSLVEETLFSRARNVFFGGVFGCTVGQLLGFACCKCGLRSFAPFVPFACAALGLIGGYFDMRHRSCHGHKARLVAHVNAVLTDLQSKYFTPARVGERSEIDRCLAVLCGMAPDRLPTAAKAKAQTAAKPSENAASPEKPKATVIKEQAILHADMLLKKASDLVSKSREGIQTGCSKANEKMSKIANGKKLRQIVEIIRS